LNTCLPDYLIIYDDGFNYLTKMCLSNMREATFHMIRMGKKLGCTVIVSSSDSTDQYESYLKEGADFILIGEGEQTLSQLLEILPSAEVSPETVQGIAFIQGEKVIKTKARPVLQQLDELPFPAWDLLDIAPYRSMWMKSSGYFSINMSTTRGCPYKCNWCAKPIYGNRYNSRTPDNVVQEIRMLKQLFAFDHIWFCDDIFGLKPGWVKKWADLISEEKISLRFKIQSRADLLIEEPYVTDLAKAGCETVWMGAESGSQRILDAMDKGISIREIQLATTLLRKHHIRPCFFIQFGYLGETLEDIELTIGMIKSLLPEELGISISYPLPGTKFYEKVKMDLKTKSHWTDSDELYMMFRNTYSPQFYKKLHRYVHAIYRQKKGWVQFKEVVNRPRSAGLGNVRALFQAAWYLPKIWLQGRQLKKLV
jgi:radical SAM superfamily enzyme YgiQ (UPF0313 family)